MEAWREELYHHGIKGQRWGKRNGPPYPLKPNDHSVAEKKAGYRNSIKREAAGGVAEELAIEMGSYAVAMLAFVAISKAIVSHNQKEEKRRNVNDSKQAGDIQKIKGKHSEEMDMSETNPGYKETSSLEYRMNCTMCSTAYELRRRGYDVEANKTRFGRTFNEVEKWYKGGKFTNCDNYDHLAKELKNQPEGARGSMHVTVGDFGSLHSMVWEKKNGKIIIRDCQSDTVYDLNSPFINKSVNNKYANRYIRTDNLEIDWDNVRDAVVPKRRY